MTTKFKMGYNGVEDDEACALRMAFAESIAKGKLFNVNTWKKKREKQRVLENKLKQMSGL